MPDGTRITLSWMPVLGAHVDSSGGLHLSFERAKAMGADAIQIHPTPPGFWGSPKLDENRITTFKEAAAKHGHPPFYFHAVYLINLAGDDPTLRQRSESTLAGYLKAADELGVNGVIFHTGSHKGAGFEARLPSVTGLGSNRDRHANIGTGQIGEQGFRALLHEPRLAKLPFILEVPGAGGGPDAEQLAVLKRLAA